MTKHLLTVAASVLVASIATSARVPAAQTTKPAPQTAATQTDEELARVGEPLVTKVCNTACHGLEKLDEMRRTGKDWSDQVGEMANRGAVATGDQFATIKKYLTRYYGIVEVNSATAAELSAVMGFTDKDAQAIVAYRTAHGKFADADALSKVPGIDKTKIEDQPEALRFD